VNYDVQILEEEHVTIFLEFYGLWPIATVLIHKTKHIGELGVL